jgi:ankyrin repeat protein
LIPFLSSRCAHPALSTHAAHLFCHALHAQSLAKPKPEATAEQRARAAQAAYDGDTAALRELAAVANLGVNDPVSSTLVGFAARPHYMLHYACVQGHAEAARALVSELGARLEVGDGEGDRPLAWAAYRGQLATVRLLLELGAEIHTARRHCRTAEVSAAIDAAIAGRR